MIHPQELRRQYGAYRPRINPRETVTADLAVHRAMIQAGAAANAIERFALLAVGQHLGPSVVQQHHVELVGPVDLLAASWPGKERGVHGQWLAGGAASQQLKEHPQVLSAGNHLFDSRNGNMNFRRRSGEPRVALILDQHDRARIRHQKVGAANSDIRRQKLLPQDGPGDHGLLFDHGFARHAQAFGEQIGHLFLGFVKRGRHDMIWPLMR